MSIGGPLVRTVSFLLAPLQVFTAGRDLKRAGSLVNIASGYVEQCNKSAPAAEGTSQWKIQLALELSKARMRTQGV
jgi:hypothetical protein